MVPKLEPEGHHGSDAPTPARAVLHHTDPKVPNIMDPSVCKMFEKVGLSQHFNILFFDMKSL